jgi:hypothetical protein
VVGNSELIGRRIVWLFKISITSETCLSSAANAGCLK